MATLQKIRNHGALLIAIVGLAMLAFILGDFLNSGSSFFNRGRENVATIEGQDIHYTEYEAAKDQLTEVYKIETGRSDMDEETASQIRNQVWQMLLADKTLSAQAKAIGMEITSDELSELCIGQNPHQIIRARRAFYDETGQFNREALVRFLNSIDQEMDEEQAANMQQAKNYWMYWENAVRMTYMQEKYTSLAQKLIGANSLDAKFAFEARQQSASAEYVVKPYFTVADSLVKVSNRDIKRLYNDRKEQYKQTPNRAIAYVSFPVVPSELDFEEVEKLMNGLTEEFRTTDDIALVVNTNSDITYNGFDYSADNIPAQYKEFAFAKGAKEGDCTELQFQNNTYSMARIMKCGYALADSVELKAIVEDGEDQELGWINAAMLPQNIAEKALKAKKGERFTIAQGMGEQTFEVMQIAPATPKVKLAILQREVTASSKTYSTIYNEAKQFIVANNSEDALREAATAAGMTVTPQYDLQATTDKVGQLKNSRSIVRWAFEAKEGEVSDVFECGQEFIVATLTDVNDGEYKSLESVRAELTVAALNDKKAEYIQKQLNGVKSLDEAAKILGTNVQTVDHVSLSDYTFGNAGAEPAIIGAALAQEANEVSAPLKGKMGVYMVRTVQKTTTDGEFNADQEKAMLSSRYQYSLPYQLMNLIESKADVKDNRYNFQ